MHCSATMGLHPPVVGPLYGGIIAGLLHTVLGPDHLCTIATLSACQGTEAFGFGVRWAGGHIAGLGLVAVVLAVLGANCSSEAVQGYEHYADYGIGALLVIFGGYFIMNSGKYFDVEWNPNFAGCACHSHSSQADSEILHEEEHLPLRPKAREGDAAGHEKHDGGLRRAGSTLMGFVQGVACPGGIVGMGFLHQYIRSFWQLLLFVSIFFVVTSLAMGCLAMAYGVLTQRYFTSATLGRAIYCASCLLSILLGLAWIILTMTDCLDLHRHAGMHHGPHIDKGVAEAPSLLAAPR